mmetsp:Transcript_9114/g.13661  ORF Transcript_9114/g.13661 Transcript_9114/m.13661 type:complete len:167 (-) Transcript_9114:46-546(-)|eukprot:CAMPEP_0171455886 /NCGR_PEP_ID=MMETSP0945-20130129/2596_1 /TAXON_ID=109269 /ORGANISM="Vaucheria litorea, Strain CCMP2940" /LENGTH=166 /DNA_ID=CAMNT_0011981205 /DNA_START=51 /DNA_END=551 /DNA_ORIENTATION=+
MLSSSLRRGSKTLASTFKHLSTQAEVKPALTLNFCLPHKTLYNDHVVDMIIIPGVAGVYGVTQGHSPVISELQPGLIKIYHEAGKEPENWFVSAGFAITKPDSVTDITAIEAVKTEDIDPEEVKKTFAMAKEAAANAPEGKEKVSAQVMMATAQAMGDAVGLQLAA